MGYRSNDDQMKAEEDEEKQEMGSYGSNFKYDDPYATHPHEDNQKSHREDLMRDDHDRWHRDDNSVSQKYGNSRGRWT